MRKDFIYILIIGVISIIITSSCKVEKDLAREFVQKENTTSILLLKDTVLYKLNDKIKRIHGFDYYDPDTQDSLWIANTQFLDSIDDTKLINNLYNRIKSELEYYEFKVYTQETRKNFDTTNPDNYTFKITQIEIEEDKYTYKNEYSFPNDTVVYFKEHDLNKFDLNCWFELKPNDTTKDYKRLFFNSFSIEDKLDGVFAKDLQQKITYKYKIIPARLTDIYNMASYSGMKNAHFLFNYFMNKYINENMPKGFLVEGYYSLDRKTGYIRYDTEENNDNSFYEIQ